MRADACRRSRTPIRRFAACAAFLGAAASLGGTAAAQGNAVYPSRPVRLVVPYPAGGPTDTASRIIGQKLGEALGQPVVIDNRPGASGTIGTESVAHSAPDGYTLVVMTNPTLLAPHLTRRKGMDWFKDLTPVAGAYDLPIVMVINPKALPDVTTLQQYVAYAKAHPGATDYTSASNGSFGHISTELLKSLGHFDAQHVPYKGSAPAMSDVLAGQVPMMFSDMVAALPHIKAGKLRPLAVGSARRVSFAPEVKTIAEQGFPGFDAASWAGIMAPAGTPRDIVGRLTAELARILADPVVQEKLQGAGTIAAYLPPDAFAKRMRDDDRKWGKVIADNGIRAD
ncbi:ABC transporter substrate-binding protein [Cupriavidus necator]|uniref:ABC transporter substrate-binding protein n=1 Tax=Cupriavidus necator TaxID=106590 RepID=A0A1U9UXW7_CUPNE|nr:tripartite tricarboxylate transporter substrate binding protein [Cupriavidus necator]AQV97512.1 ABC transporter substrate-binding protein [Cupriavidus necator]